MPESVPQPPSFPQARAADARVALVFGGSGQIGQPLLARLVAAGWEVVAVSRQPQAPQPGLRWLHGDLSQIDGLPPRADAIFSCGPLDRFSQWFAGDVPASPRVVAFGSTSVEVKQSSADADERDLARRLRDAEALLFDLAARRGIGVTVLRPTLVYGAGRDATLSRIAAMAMRLRGFALPVDATGLRQPVHVDDLAAAALACMDVAAAHGQAYALPGGETLAYRDMVARVLVPLPSRPRLWVLPTPLFRVALRLARLAGVATGFSDAALARMREDLAFEDAPARRDFGYAPRAFAPTAAMLRPPA